MRIDVVSIFVDYLQPLQLSLPGKAIAAGLVDLRVHDLRQWTYDRHRTVDDTPYGGGAGMVMKPEPWGAALDMLLADEPPPRLIVPTPSGIPFTQAKAVELAQEPRLAFACGRYEGIDARVAQWAKTKMVVDEISIGDYVLNGGEVAALVIIEAVLRLIPGVIGNPESLMEESHTLGEETLLEYPSFTKPDTWRELQVPAVLLSGDHAAIARWRYQQAADLTRLRRPDLWAQLPANPTSLLPQGQIPVPPSDTDQFRFEVLAEHHNEGDWLAWSGSIEHIRQTPGFKKSSWPQQECSQSENLADLRRHHACHNAGVSFAWSVLDPVDGSVLGCVYLIPTSRSGYVAEARSWVRADRSSLDLALRRHIVAWLAEKLPELKIYYQSR